MENERGTVITIGGEKHELLLTTRATKEIAGRYGGLEKLGDRLMKAENFEEALGEVIWLITLLANQSKMVHNLRHKSDPIPMLSEEEVELLTSPADIAEFKTAIMQCLSNGTKRNVESEESSKNVTAE